MRGLEFDTPSTWQHASNIPCVLHGSSWAPEGLAFMKKKGNFLGPWRHLATVLASWVTSIGLATRSVAYIYIIQLYSSCLLLFTDSFLVHSFVRSFIHSFIDLFMFVYSWCMYLPIDLSVHLSPRHHIFVEFGIPRTASECAGSAV